MYFFVAATFTMMTVSCSKSSAVKSPKEIEESIYTEVQNGNFDKAVELFYDNVDRGDNASTKIEKEEMKAISEKTKQSAEVKGGLKSFDILSETISEDGKTATVSTQINYGNGSVDLQQSSYMNKDGVWKMTVDN